MPRPRKLLIALALVLPVAGGGFILRTEHAAAAQQTTLLGQVIQLVTQRYVDTVSQSDAFEKAARGLVKELNDPYSELLTPKDMKQFNSRTQGRYAGLGMLIEDQQGNITVSKVYPNTPAERGGVRAGDRIIQADTLSTRGWTLSQVSDYLVGTEGTKVTVKFVRPGVDAPIMQQFTRAVIHVPAVPFAISFDHVGYVPLQTFNENGTDEALAAIKGLTASGVTGIVLDLRGNPGGILDQSISVANLFLKQGLQVASVRARTGEAQSYTTEHAAALPSTPLVVLTDAFSASASEIVSGALQDHDRALIIGQTTFGKGLVQSVFNLQGGYALKLTTAKWFTPSGRSIQRERKYVNGQFVEEPVDSTETNATRKPRPAFKSDLGRTVYGGGGVTPDVLIAEDTLTTVEQAFVKAMTPKNQQFYLVLYDYALELSKSGQLSRDFVVPPAWRDEFYRRLAAKGAVADQKAFDAAARYIDRQLGQFVARFAFGDSTAKRRDLAFDAALRRALELLRDSKTQAQLFTAAASGSGKGR
jgi:carboxyl-terminal processing protease